jgi:hypothetical protein
MIQRAEVVEERERTIEALRTHGAKPVRRLLLGSDRPTMRFDGRVAAHDRRAVKLADFDWRKFYDKETQEKLLAGCAIS